MWVRRDMVFEGRWMDIVMPTRHLEQTEMSLELRQEIWAGGRIWECLANRRYLKFWGWMRGRQCKVS